MAKILVAEDDSALLDQITQWLKQEHYTVEAVSDGQSALEFLRAYEYDIVLLDWEMPGKTGLEVLKELRSKGNRTPVLMLTGKSELNDKESGLDTGADDYITKPFEFRELSARIRSALRRSTGQTSITLKVGDLTLDPQNHEVKCGEELVKLLPKEFALLEFFMRHPNEVFNGEALLERIWEADSEASTNTVKSYMYTLRKKLSAHGKGEVIATIHGVGYKLSNSQEST